MTPHPPSPADTTSLVKAEGRDDPAAGGDDAWLRRLARRLVRDEEEAQDLAQETWLAALRNPPRDGERRQWLRATARKLAARRWGLRRELSIEGLELEVLTDEDGPVSSTLRTDSERMVNTALAELSERDRNIILWRWHDGHSYTAIAQRLGLTRQSATYRVERAVEALRSRLQRLSPGTPLLGLAPLLGLDARRAAPTVTPATLLVAGVVSAALLVVLGIGATRAYGELNAAAPKNAAEVSLEEAAGPASGTGEVGRGAGFDPGRLAVPPSPPGTTTPHATPSAQAAGAAQPPVSVQGRWQFDGQAGVDWEAMLIPQEGQGTVNHDGGRAPLDDQGEFFVLGKQPGSYTLALYQPQGMSAFRLEVVLADTAELDVNVLTGTVRVSGIPPDGVRLLATGTFGSYEAFGAWADGEPVVFPLVPAGPIEFRAVVPDADAGNDPHLGTYSLPVGGEITVDLD
jgi:RNA polymerase sigma factor (sigma-70 family)